MRKAALYVHGKIVLGDSHLEAFQKLTVGEQDEDLVSGEFDTDTEEFNSEMPDDHFYDKEMILLRHGLAEDAAEPDADISEVGIQQVHKLASLLVQTFEPKQFVGITSPLLRCLKTSLIIHEILDVQFKIQSSVMETPLFLEDDQQYRLQNHHDKFPQFDWFTHEDWILTKETSRNFIDRTKQALQHFPHRCIVVTHLGFICNIARLALSENKAANIPPASITYICQQDVKCLGRTF
jgi:broad specificity phosphatase PhoE